MSQAGALMAVLTGALWPGDRLESQDPLYKCPRCQWAGYDEVHMFYACPALVTSRRPMIQKTKHLVDIANRDNFNPPCYYLRGLQPKANTTPTTEPHWSAASVGQGANITHWQRPMDVYADGSGALTIVTPD
eukprot:7622122-Karenia_brevis.AAC.1